MTPEQVGLIQQSFTKVEPIAPQAAALFYGRLFDIYPDARPLFKGDMEDQGRKLMSTLGTVVNNLANLENIMPAVQNLAIRHVEYGVRPEHYAPVGASLLWTLKQGLGADFTAETENAWKAAYGAVSGAMIEAAYPAVRTAKGFAR